MKPRLRHPFEGDFPISFGFGERPVDETIKRKYVQWGLSGHNGIDYLMPEGTTVLAAATGIVTQAGEGDFGISVMISHSWGQSLYGHLQETKVSVGQKVKSGQLIGLSGKTGFVTGPHLHFGLKPATPDVANGFHGYIDPSSYFLKQSKHKKAS